MSTRAKPPGPEEHGSQRTQNVPHDDDTIVVPKGTSKLRFLFLLGLTIFILIIFTVGDQLMSSVGRQPGNVNVLSWDGPVIGKRAFTASELLDEKRREDDYRRVTNKRESIDDQDFAQELLLDELARKSGIEVPVKELNQEIMEGKQGLSPAFQNKPLYLMMLERSGVAPLVYEGVLRRKLRVQRYVQFLVAAMPAADSASIERAWKKSHPQVAFDVIESAHADFDAEAKQLQPDAAGLKAWYDALPDKHTLFFADFLPASSSAEIIAYRFGAENTAAGLLERFPLPADRDAEQLAKDYYNQYSSVRFVRDTPLPEAEAEAKDRLISSYEEVAEVARKEALVLAAFRSWVSDVKSRKQGGEAVNLEAEATTFGLSYRPADGAKTEAEWSAITDFGGPFLARSILGAQKDDFGADISVDRGALAFPRVLERNEASAPPYEKVADKVATEWLKQKTQELATAKLNLVRDALPKPAETEKNQNPKVDETAFKAAAEAQGFKVERRDWMTFQEQVNDPDSTKPSHDFLRVNGYLRSLAADEVAPVQPDRARTHSYLVRSLGEREPPEAKLGPGDVAGIRKSLQKESGEAFREANFTPKALAEKYKLHVGSKDNPEPGT